jgi:hypothetical protein
LQNEARYFGHFAPDGVFKGTDDTERWTLVDGIVRQIGVK